MGKHTVRFYGLYATSSQATASSLRIEALGNLESVKTPGRHHKGYGTFLPYLRRSGNAGKSGVAEHHQKEIPLIKKTLAFVPVILYNKAMQSSWRTCFISQIRARFHHDLFFWPRARTLI